MSQLRQLSRDLIGRPHTAIATTERRSRYSQIADVVVGAVLRPGRRAPHLITEEMVKRMKTGSVIIDVSVDQGGCVATTRPTTLDRPTFTQHGVVHYCVANMPGAVALSSTFALTSVTNRYGIQLANLGVDAAIKISMPLKTALNVYKGKLVNEPVAKAHNMKFEQIQGEVVYPPWIGNELLHSSHRANLLRKDKEYYSAHGWRENPADPYAWFDTEKQEWYLQHVGTGKREYLLK